MISQQIVSSELPERLRQIPSSPKHLFVLGAPLDEYKESACLSVIGSRALSPYGKLAAQQLLPDVVRAGVTIISGLALGADALAHRITLDHSGRTIAVLPSSVNEVYPATNRQLAQEILQKNGTLVSEYPDGTDARRENFIARNRLVSGLSHAILIIEAAEKSGTLHTANFALEQGRDVMVVPGNITSPQSIGTNNLLKAGATPVTSSTDILRALGIEKTATQQTLFANTPEEAILIKLLQNGIHEGAQLLHRSELDPQTYSQTMTMLELQGNIKPLGADNWSLG